MLLKICDENFWFMIGQSKYINVACVLIIFLCIFLCLLIKNKFLEKFELDFSMFKVFIPLVMVGIIVAFFSVFLVLLHTERYYGCECEISDELLDFSSFPGTEKLDDTTKHKVVIVGDSRMEFIETAKMGTVDIPDNVLFIAKSGAAIDWLNDVATVELDKLLDDEYTYYVVLNFGINDFYDDIDIDERVNEYFEIYKKLAFKYPSVKFHILSVNPIEKGLLFYNFRAMKTNNEKIEKFNDIMSELVDEESLRNMVFCDSYSQIYFKTVDGLHYNKNTNQEIVDYVVNECVA